MIETITVVGGTHGNEYIGPYLLRQLKDHGATSSKLPVQYLLANPEAFRQGKRFIEDDLNRSFSNEVLSSPAPSSVEHRRAQEIHQQLGPKPSKNNFIIDLHSTTANMGLTLIVHDHTRLNLIAAAYLQQHIPNVKIIMSDVDSQFSRTLSGLSQFGLSIEVGPLPNAVLRHDLFESTAQMVQRLIEFLNLTPIEQQDLAPDSVEIYKVRERVPYPYDDKGELSAMVHSDLQDRDFQLLEPDTPIFYCLDGSVLNYMGEPGYPIFINEAAYYRENTAFVITDKITHKLFEEAPKPS